MSKYQRMHSTNHKRPNVSCESDTFSWMELHDWLNDHLPSQCSGIECRVMAKATRGTEWFFAGFTIICVAPFSFSDGFSTFTITKCENFNRDYLFIDTFRLRRIFVVTAWAAWACGWNNVCAIAQSTQDDPVRFQSSASDSCPARSLVGVARRSRILWTQWHLTCWRK